MKIFPKRKDYHNLLEEILDKKTFSSIAKSLCLSMVYKLEVSYKDYSVVKVDGVSKEVFLNSILEVIQNYCEHIKIVEPESSQANLLVKNGVSTLTNTKERSILAYPTEIAMLEAISDIEPKYFFIQKDFEFKNVFQRLLVNGFKQNNIEILKNFTGWSWEVTSHEKMDYVAYLIYQNIMMIKGELFLYNWRKESKGKKNYFVDLKRSLKNITGNEAYYEALCKILNSVAKQKDSKSIKKDFIELQKCFLKLMEKKIEKVSLCEDVIRLIYQLRLYQNLNFWNDELVKENKEISKTLCFVQKLLITKACKLGVLKIVSMDIETNFEIFRFVLDTRMIDLEQVRINLKIEGEKLFLKVYEKEVFEKEGYIKWTGNKKDIVIRKNKTINLFN